MSFAFVSAYLSFTARVMRIGSRWHLGNRCFCNCVFGKEVIIIVIVCCGVNKCRVKNVIASEPVRCRSPVGDISLTGCISKVAVTILYIRQSKHFYRRVMNITPNDMSGLKHIWWGNIVVIHI